MTEKTSKVKASFDLTTVEGQKKFFNAKNGASVSLRKLDDGTVIECNGAMIYHDVIDTYVKDKTEAKEGKISVLFGVDGQSYAGVSDTVAKATDSLIDFLEMTGLETFNVRLTKQTSGGGNEFLNIQLV